jgi:CheY-like chemotaxis protein
MQGTTICLFLPAAAEVTSSPVIRPRPSATTSSHDLQAHVLVVDDDLQVLDFIAESLRALGYRVTARSEPAQALELLPTQRFELLVVDFAMPGMNGAQLARAVRDAQPGIAVLLVSGYADSAAIEAALGDAPVLRKPFDVTQLADAVADVLERSRSSTGSRGLSNS